ncbi:hypothetical protein H8K52_18390 [Undibacterium seohonense]|jgi:hypothetical protein|uniref:Lipoprotein n=2 Tax=Undibacterium seohonense TaxID=1344950 RepID=A0ABR6X8P5_9BURK|nr:hypothetical protein [Undibacterium seohonense]
MLREKLFLSMASLMLSLLASLACLPLFAAIFQNRAIAGQFGTAVIFLLPVLSLSLLWRANPASHYDLRRFCFLGWATLLCLIGVSNFVLVQDQANSNNTVLMVGIVCAAISMHAAKKAQKLASR